MNEHLRRLKEEDEKFRRQKKLGFRTSFAGVLICVVLIVFFSWLFPRQEQKSGSTSSAQGNMASQAAVADTSGTGVGRDEVRSWELVLVNKRQRVAEDFSVSLRSFGAEQVDERIWQSLTDLIDAAQAEGVNLLVCSGYRNKEDQAVLYEAKIQQGLDSGLSQEKSVAAAGQLVQPAGASEHHTGLAVDIVTEAYQLLDEGFAETDAYRWLQENAAKYGFVERYTKEKQALTEVSYEPWHYRYVGVRHAEKMNLTGQCLEEYITSLRETENSMS